ncbi:amino acid adenylation domain-containing protein [Leptolyngbya cf. ectocarpi LEGE 11479]|uniref:Amino acid adenylation domain-containing protein n=2 Tax=Leptolyngbya ectocarpi TaxID=1202 RepID=A0A928ZUU3_LEPEC|nr:amino acid adenylation domain-containing protein [Leptolyngbya cf. ectocarpi LEGE 11479]
MSFSKVPTSKLPISLKSSHATDQQGAWSASQVYTNQPDWFPEDCCIHTLFEQQVQRTPHAVAVIAEDAQLTYQQLNRQANRLAYQLATLGVGPDHLVGICVERSLDMVVGLLGILKAGGTYVPIDPHYPTERIKFILQDAQVNILLSQTHLEQTLVDCLPKDTALICLDRDQWKNMRSCPDRPTAVDTDNLMYVIYTSGSTGHPKGVMIPHSGACNQLHWRQTTFPLGPQDRVLQNISFSFDPSVWQIFWPLLVGAQLVLPRPNGHQDIAYLVDLIARQNVSVIALVPSLLRVLLEQPGLDQCDALNHIFCGGEALTLDLQQQFFKRFSKDSVQLHNVYGPTEASIDATSWTCQQGVNYPIAPIGHPISNAQIHILDDALKPVNIEEIGEIYIGGSGLARGYLNRPELTTARFITYPPDRSRIYRTGDLGKSLPDGTIQFIGRVDQQVKIRGFRIELGEIESCLDQHPAIAQSAVIAWEFAPGQKRLFAYFIPNADMTVDVKTLRSWLAQRLPDYMVPAMFMPLTAFPLNANGKLDRKALPTPISEHTHVSDDGEPLQDDWELKLAELWGLILQVSSVSQTDNFFELGGDSLLAAQLSARIEQTFNHPFPVANLFKAPTLHEMATLLKENTGYEAGQVLVPIQPEGSKPVLFCLHTKTGSIFDYYGLAKHLGADQPVYGIQARGFDREEVHCDRIETMAADYIQEIQSLQPQGPYYLCGYSFGGLLAYEIAQQLTRQGHTIGLVALFDTYNYPGAWFDEPLSLRLQNTISKIQAFSWAERIAYGQQKLQHIRNFLQRVSTGQQQAQAKISIQETVCETALKQYQTKPYSGDIVLFRTEQTPEAFGYRSIERDATLGWHNIVTGTINIQPMACHHFVLIDEPHIQTLAQKLHICLNEYQDNG